MKILDRTAVYTGWEEGMFNDLMTAYTVIAIVATFIDGIMLVRG